MKNLLSAMYEKYDLSVMAGIPVTDKLRLVEYIKALGAINDLYREKGESAVKSTDIRTLDKTLNLMLFWNFEMGFEEGFCLQLIKNYLHCFEDSAVYSSKILCLGLGAILIKKGTDTNSLILFLTHLLGADFVEDEYNKLYTDRLNFKLDEQTKIFIQYKDFNLTYRTVKYELLALLKMSKEDGADLHKLVYEVYKNDELADKFSILNVADAEIAEIVFKDLIKHAPKNDRFYLNAARCILNNYSVEEMHYMLNSELGKLTKIEKSPEEIDAEIEKHRKQILGK